MVSSGNFTKNTNFVMEAKADFHGILMFYIL